MSGRERVAWLLLLLPASACAQGQAAGDFVAGTVLDGSDEHAIAGATVALIDVQTEVTVATTRSDERGHYEFAPLKAGKYRLSGSAPGYFTASYLSHGVYSTAIVTGAGLPTTALVLHIARAARLYGRVLDQTGAPVGGALVRLFVKDRTTAHHAIAGPVSYTSESGEFEFARLAPETYYLSAEGVPWDAARQETRGAGSLFATYIDPALDRMYPPTFYPNAMVSDEAEPISLAAGSQVVANFQLNAIKPATLAVQLEGHAEASRTELTLYREVFGTWERTAAEEGTEPGGGLSLSGVAPGTYRLQQVDAESRSPGLQRTVEIAGQASSVALQPRLSEATVTVKGHGDFKPNVTTVGLILDGADGEVMETASFDEHQTAVLRNVQPGRYLVVADSLEAGQRVGLLALSEGGKVKVDQHLEVKSGNLRADVTLGRTVKSVDGVTEVAGKARPGAMVVLVPAGADTRRELFRRDQSDLDGSFTFFNVLPGRYLVIALDDAWNLAWDDVAVLAPYLLHATPVEVPANGVTTYHMKAAVDAQAR